MRNVIYQEAKRSISIDRVVRIMTIPCRPSTFITNTNNTSLKSERIQKTFGGNHTSKIQEEIQG